MLSADLPGVREGDIDVQVHEGVLLLSGKRERETSEDGDGRLYRERRHGSFHRSFRLGDNIDAEKIEASCDNGVLTVSLPKKDKSSRARSRSLRTEPNLPRRLGRRWSPATAAAAQGSW